MKVSFTLDKQTYKHLEDLKKIKLAKTSMSILRSLHMQGLVNPERLVFTVTNLELWIQKSIPVTMLDVEGQTIIPDTKVFLNLLKPMIGSQVTIEATTIADKPVVIVNGITIPCDNHPDKYPKFPEVNEEKSIDLIVTNYKQFTEGLKAIAPYMSTDETRYNLNGTYIEEDTMTATDGHRLMQVKPAGITWKCLENTNKEKELGATKEEAGVMSSLSRIMPRVLVNFIATLPDVNYIRMSKDYWKVSRGYELGLCTILYHRNVEGRFPDVDGVIPNRDTHNPAVKVNMTAVKDFIKKTKALGKTEGTEAIEFYITPARLHMAYKHTESAVLLKEDVPCEAINNPTVFASFNRNYLAEFPDGEMPFQLDERIKSLMQLGPMRVDVDNKIIVLMPCRMNADSFVNPEWVDLYVEINKQLSEAHGY